LKLAGEYDSRNPPISEEPPFSYRASLFNCVSKFALKAVRFNDAIYFGITISLILNELLFMSRTLRASSLSAFTRVGLKYRASRALSFGFLDNREM
jgi:hypothetical protein